MSIVSAITGLMKTFFFLFPFVMELFLGKAPNPYSRNPKDWRPGQPAHHWVRRLAIIAGILSFVFNYYLVTRLIAMDAENRKLKKEIAVLKTQQGGSVPAAPDITPPATTQDITPTLDVKASLSAVPTVTQNAVTVEDPPEVKPAPKPKPKPKPVKPKTADLAEEQKAHNDLMKRLQEIERIGRD